MADTSYIEIGDYRYSFNASDSSVAVKVLDKKKTSYGQIASTVSFSSGGTAYPVTDARECFAYCVNLITAPNIPDTVTKMNYCFAYCTSLTSVPHIPDSAISMSFCFTNCTSLTSVPHIPDSVTNMVECFFKCTSLTSIPNIPNSATNMSRCFTYCASLTSVPHISDSVTNMYQCFTDCTSLPSVPNIPNSVTDMGHCFFDCTSLTSVPNIPNTVTNMYCCFYNCTSLTGGIYVSNEFLEGDTRSYQYMFSHCPNEIYIINAEYGTSSEADVARSWREALSDAPSNVHYEADDKSPPYITATVQRIDSNGNYSTAGNYAKVTITTSSSNDNIPPASVSSRFIQPEVTTTEVFVNDSTNAVSNYNNIDLGTNYADQFNFRCKATDNYGDSSEVTITLSRILALLDFLGIPTSDYPGDEPGMGVAIGTLATHNGVEIAFPVSIGQELLPPSTGTGSSKKVNLDSYQLTLGKFNKQDNNNVVVIGNGTSDSSRSNALTVDQYGNIRMYLGSNTTDTSLLSAITALSWNSEVIESD